MAVVVVGAAALSAASWVTALHVWKPAYESGSLRAAHPVSRSQVLFETRPSDPGVPCSWPELSAYIGEHGMCRQSQKGTDADVVLLGDSHAEHLYPGLVEALATQNVALMAVRAPYMFGSQAGLDLALDSIMEGGQRPTVVISRSWTRGALSREDQYEPLDHAVRRLTSAGLSVVLLDDVPDFPFPTSSCRYRIAPVVPHAVCTQPRTRVDEARDAYLADLRRIAAAYQGTEVVEVGLSLCNETACSMLSEGLLAYSDADHLNYVGSTVFGSSLADAAGLDRPRAGE